MDSVMAQATDDVGHGHSTAVIALRFSSRAVGSPVGSYDSSHAHPRTHMLELNTTASGVLADDMVRRFTHHQVGSETGAVWELATSTTPTGSSS